MHGGLKRVFVTSLLAAAPALALVAAYAPAAGASTAPAHSSAHPAHSAGAAQIARAAIRHLAIGQHGANHAVYSRAARVKGLTQVQSSNWSGYANDNSTGKTYATVTGNWTQPSATCGSQLSLAAFWVGIDGYSSDSVEQDGTLVECYEGSAYYYTWWEMYPTNDIQVVGESLSPGDAISASVVRTGTSYTLKVTDATHKANSFTTTQTCSGCANSSAEWIAEAPSGAAGVYPLADFRSWEEWGATVKSGSTTGVIPTFPDDEITMVGASGDTLAQPGPLNTRGKEFTVTWKASS
jgi:hypothetical protein